MAATLVDPGVLPALLVADSTAEAERCVREAGLPHDGVPGAAELRAALLDWETATRTRDALRHRDPVSAAEVRPLHQALGVVVVLFSILSLGAWGFAVGLVVAGAGAIAWLVAWRLYRRRWRVAGEEVEAEWAERRARFRAAARTLLEHPWAVGPAGRERVNVPALHALRQLRRRVLDHAPRARELDERLKAAVRAVEAEAAAGRPADPPLDALVAAVEAACGGGATVPAPETGLG